MNVEDKQPLSFNTRILVTEYKTPDGEITPWFQAHEVYYDKEGTPNGYTANGITTGGENVKELEWQLGEMKKALDKPFLWGDDRFPMEYSP